MCGFFGIIGQKSADVSEHVISNAFSSISRRGPDCQNKLVDVERGILLGHSRLVIRGDEITGSQPMRSESGRLILVFNGEIYNCNELLLAIKDKTGHSYYSKSDTDVLLCSLELIGFEETIRILRGIFAFALVDLYKECVYIASDNVASKPIYWIHKDKSFVFASSLQLIKDLFKPLNLDLDSLSNYLIKSYVPHPSTIFEGVLKIGPKSWVCYDFKNDIIESGAYRYEHQFADENTDFSRVLSGVVEDQLVSDANVGIFLSGGVDSSLLAAISSKILGKKDIQCFSLGFERSTILDETDQASDLARFLGLEVNVVHPSLDEQMEAVEILPTLFDEPFADSSAVPTLLLSQYAARSIKVALGGDGGDEFFAGYSRYDWMASLQILSSTGLRNLASGAIEPFLWVLKNFPKAEKDLGKALRLSLPTHRLEKLQKILRLNSNNDRYEFLTRQLSQSELDLVFPKNETKLIDHAEILNSCKNPRELSLVMRLVDRATYLPGDILTKVDRSSMGFGLEVRAPYLDQKIETWVDKNPELVGFRKKPLLRRELYKLVPQSKFNQPKSGFAAPLESLISQASRIGYVDSLICETEADLCNLINFKIVTEWYHHALLGDRSASLRFWVVFCFLQWFRRNKGYLRLE